MRRPRARFGIRSLMFSGALVALDGSDLLACSGRGAARTIGDSIAIGWSLGGLSLALVVAGGQVLRRRSCRGRIPWIVAPLMIHPAWWMSATRGDCGFGLRLWSCVATLWVAAAVALALCWPRRGEANPGAWRRAVGGALAGAVLGIPIALLVLDGPGSMAGPSSLTLVAAVPCSLVVAGALIGWERSRPRPPGVGRFRFRLWTIFLLPLVLAPLFAALLPVLPYEASTRTTRPVRFVVVDDATGRPIPFATFRLIDPRLPPDDLENQPNWDILGDSGPEAQFLRASIHGRAGLLGRVETITYNPMLIGIEAPGYRPFFTSLASDPPIPADRLTAPPLGLTFPPPPSVMIRMTPSPRDDGADPGRHSPVP